MTVSEKNIEDCQKENERLNSEVKLYRSMFDKSHVAQVIIDPQFNIIDMNDAFCKIVNFPDEKLRGMDFRNFKDKKMLDYLYDEGQGLTDALTLKKPVHAHAAFVATNGTHIINRNIIPFLDEKGQVKNVYIIYNEVTEIENKMAEVERLQKQSEAIVQQNPMPILLWDKNLTVTSFNKAFVDLTGFSKQQAARLTITDFNYHAQSGQSVADTVKTGLASKGEAVIQFPSGERVVERYNIPLVDAKGALTSILTVYNNITDQKRAIKDILTVSAESEKGNLSARTKEENYTGDFFEIAHGINRTLDVVIGPLNVAAEYVDRISKGDIPPKIKETYYGDFNEIKNNLNQCIDAVNLLIEDTRMLTNATVEGRLDARADASRHQGDFAKVVQGVNDTLDAVIGPVHEAMRLSDQLAQCIFSARFDDRITVSGDFVQFKSALNNIGMRIEDAIMEINRVADNYASGDFSVGINPELNIQGDLVILKEALNKISVNVSQSLALVNIKMNDLLTEADQASTGVSDVSRGAEMITKNAEDTKLNAERSDEGITQVLRTMEDLTKTVSEVSSNAEAVAVLSNKTNQLAKEGITHAGRAEKNVLSEGWWKEAS